MVPSFESDYSCGCLSLTIYAKLLVTLLSTFIVFRPSLARKTSVVVRLSFNFSSMMNFAKPSNARNTESGSFMLTWCIPLKELGLCHVKMRVYLLACLSRKVLETRLIVVRYLVLVIYE